MPISTFPEGTYTQQGAALLGGNGGYRPAGLVTYTMPATTPADVDATNAVWTFVAPPDGVVLLRAQGYVDVAAAVSSTVIASWSLRTAAGDVAGTQQQVATISAGAGGTQTFGATVTAEWRLSGLTPGTSYTYKLGHFRNTGGTANTYAGANGGALILEAWSQGGALSRFLVAPTICTSTSRPTTGLYAGLQIFETDTGRTLVWNGSAWQPPTNTGWGRVAAAVPGGTFTTTETVMATLSFTVPAGAGTRLVRLESQTLWYTATDAGQIFTRIRQTNLAGAVLGTLAWRVAGLNNGVGADQASGIFAVDVAVGPGTYTYVLTATGASATTRGPAGTPNLFEAIDVGALAGPF